MIWGYDDMGPPMKCESLMKMQIRYLALDLSTLYWRATAQLEPDLLHELHPQRLKRLLPNRPPPSALENMPRALTHFPLGPKHINFVGAPRLLPMRKRDPPLLHRIPDTAVRPLVDGRLRPVVLPIRVELEVVLIIVIVQVERVAKVERGGARRRRGGDRVRYGVEEIREVGLVPDARGRVLVEDVAPHAVPGPTVPRARAMQSVGHATRVSPMRSSTRSTISSSGVLRQMSYAERRSDALVTDWQMAFRRRTTAWDVQSDAGRDHARDAEPVSPMISGWWIVLADCGRVRDRDLLASRAVDGFSPL